MKSKAFNPSDIESAKELWRSVGGARELKVHRDTREDILQAATRVFAKHGFEGATLQKISKAAKSVDRMIYYYFRSKEGLFIAVLERMYVQMNHAESLIELSSDKPEQALSEVIEFVMRYYREHPEFITLLNTENLHQGRHIVKSLHAAKYSSPAVNVIKNILKRGQQMGLFRSQVRALDVYLLIVSTNYFYVSNRFTLSAFLGRDLQASKEVSRWRKFVTQTVLSTVRIE
jgi:TetR/AcrR family transcriptional regulator, upper aerobic nicotinate degradation pathway regulator